MTSGRQASRQKSTCQASEWGKCNIRQAGKRAGDRRTKRSQDVRHVHRKLPRNKSQTAVFVKALSCMSDIQKRKNHRVGMWRSG